MTTMLMTKRKSNPIENLKCLERYVVNMMMMMMVSLFPITNSSLNFCKKKEKRKKKISTASCIALSKLNEKSLIKKKSNRFLI